MADDDIKSLVPTSGGAPWSGDDHKLAVAAAKEAGLDTVELEVQSYTEGFKQGLTLDDPADHAIVLRGRTVLKEKQLLNQLRRHLHVSRDVLRSQFHSRVNIVTAWRTGTHIREVHSQPPPATRGAHRASHTRVS